MNFSDRRLARRIDHVLVTFYGPVLNLSFRPVVQPLPPFHYETLVETGSTDPFIQVFQAIQVPLIARRIR